MIKGLVKKVFNGRESEWKTKHLRDAYMNGLLKAKIPQEVKDATVGHKREGARHDYALTEDTIKTAYQDAFKFLTVNGFGSTNRKIEELEQKMTEDKLALTNLLTAQQQKMKELTDYITQVESSLADRDLRIRKIDGKIEITNAKVEDMKLTLMRIEDILKIRKKDVAEH